MISKHFIEFLVTVWDSLLDSQLITSLAPLELSAATPTCEKGTRCWRSIIRAEGVLCVHEWSGIFVCCRERNSCFYSVPTLWSSRLLSKNSKIKINKTITWLLSRLCSLQLSCDHFISQMILRVVLFLYYYVTHSQLFYVNWTCSLKYI